MQIKIKGKSIGKLFFITLAGLIAVLFALFIYANSYYRNAVKTGILTENENNLHRISFILDSEIKKAVVTKDIINSEKTLSKLFLTEDHTDFQNNCEELKDSLMWFSEENNFIYDIYIELPEKNTVISGTGVYDSDYFNKAYSFSNLSINRFDQSKISIIELSFSNLYQGYPNKDAEHIPLMIISYTGEKYKINFLYDCNSIKEVFPEYGIKNSAIYIKDKADLYLLLTGEKQTENKPTTAGDGVSDFLGKKAFVKSIKSSVLDFDYISAYPYSVYSTKVNQNNFVFYLLLVIAVSAVCLILYILNARVITPIIRISENLERLPGENGEIQAIKDYISDVSKKNKELERLMKNSRVFIKHTMIESLMIGEKNFGDFPEYFKQYTGPEYLLIKLISENNLAGNMEKLELYFDDMHILSQKAMIKNSSIIYFLSYDYESLQIMQDISELLINAVCLISHETGDYKEISHMYRDIELISKNRNIMKTSGILTKNDIISENRYIYTVETMQNDILDCMREGNIQAFMELHEGFSLENKAVSHREGLDIIYFYRKMIKIMIGGNGQILDALDIDMNILDSDIDECVSLADLGKEYIDIMLRIVKQNAKYDGSKQDRIIAYLKENFAKSISLENVANRFGMNPKYLSGYIKKQIGMTFTDFVAKLRVEASKQMLMDDSMNIREISESLGFDSQSSFNRLFKKVCNMTPAQYREIEKRKY